MSEQKEACCTIHTWPVRKVFQCGDCPMWVYDEEKSRSSKKAAGYCPRKQVFAFADEYGVDVSGKDRNPA